MTLMEILVARLKQGQGLFERSLAGWRRGRRGSVLSEPEALAALSAATPQRRWEAAGALGRSALSGRAAISALAGALADPEPFVRWQAARALAAQEAGAVFPVMRSLLADADPLRRAGAAEALGCLGGEAASVALRQALPDADPGVRRAVVEALGACGDPGAAPALLPALQDADGDVRRAAATALGRIGNPGMARALANMLAAPDSPLLLRRALAGALAHIPHPEVQPALLSALADADPQVRAYAAQALGQVGDEDACGPLAVLRSDSSPTLRGTVGEQAARALVLLERRGRHAPGAPGGPSPAAKRKTPAGG
jgi:HEAT repeat protein